MDMENTGLKRREMDTQFEVSKHNSILDLVHTCRIMSKVIFDKSRKYGLKGALSLIHI